ncbi:MAG: HAMP domain-containing sensor histidine kinase [Pseudomonadota bacterium]
MFTTRLYYKLCLIVLGSLLVFAVFATALWVVSGHHSFEKMLFQKTTSLAILLFPPDAEFGIQADAVREVADSLDIDLTLWAPNRTLLGASGQVAEVPNHDVPVGDWIPTEGRSRWTTKLPDGRFLIIDIERLEMLDDATGAVLALLFLALSTAVATYPFIRHITKRLEALQQEVEQIGGGDLTARVEIEGNDEIATLARSFNRSAEKIENLVTAQRMLLANASHELRTPLARIRLGIEMLENGKNVERRNALKADIRELDELVDELLLMTRLDSGSHNKSFTNLDLIAIAAEECSRYQNCEVSGSQGEVYGERRMLRHLVRNLIDNAHKHGMLPVQVIVSSSEDTVSLTVVDGGSGIPDDQLVKVFEPFYRAPGKQDVPGYGLGLPLVKRIAEFHNGQLSVSNDPRSSISLTFPAAK